MLSRVLMWFAAGLLVLGGVIHSYLGETLLFPRLFAMPDLPLFRSDRRFTEAVLRYAWHLTSFAWWGIAAAIAVMPLAADLHKVGRILGATVFLTGAIIVFTCGVRHPGWLIFMTAGACVLYATR